MSDAASMTPDASLRHAFVAADAMFSTVIEMAQVAEGWGTELFDADAALAGMCGGFKNMALYVGVLRRALTELRLAIPETPIIDLPPGCGHMSRAKLIATVTELRQDGRVAGFGFDDGAELVK